MERANRGSWPALGSAAQRLGLRPLWQWWLSQLRPLVPARARNAIGRRRLRPMLVPEADAVTLWVPGMTHGTLGFSEVARISLSGDAAAVAQAGRAMIDALPQVAYGGVVAGARVLVALPAAQVLRKTLAYPAAVEEDLRSTLAYDLDRLTPFKADEVYFDAVVVGRNSQTNEIRVDWAAARRTVVDQACRQAESWGAMVVGVTPESPARLAATSGSTLNLLPAAMRPDTAKSRRRRLWMPLALVVVAALVATALPIWQKRETAIALMQIVDQARAQADASDALRRQFDEAIGDYNLALQRKYAFPATVQVVEDVTKLLPDDTWLTQFEMKTTARGKDARRELVLRGESGNAGRLISLLEESNLFEQAAPRSPTTKIQPGPGEIFELGAKLKSLSPPERVEVVGERSAAVPPLSAPDAGSPGFPVPATPPGGPGLGEAKRDDSSGTPPAPAAGQPGKTSAAAPVSGPAQPGRAPAGNPPRGEAQPTAPGSAPAGPTVPDVPDDY
ncbi:MAG: pilus assembly protein PilM [Betaproteobacteria bacterium]|nr:pilus assembly protein PilM [Betaproteobacteria bacterium]